MMTGIVGSPVFAVTVTLLAYFGAQQLYLRFRYFFLNPVLLSVGVLIALLRLLRVDYATYDEGGRFINFFLGPSVVALGVLLHSEMKAIRKRLLSVMLSIVVGSVAGIISVVAVARWLGGSPDVVSSMAPKSVTTPIAMGIADNIGGIAPLTAAIVVSVGVLGAVAGPSFLRLIRVRDRLARGIAMGAASHGIGTARILEEGELEGAGGGLAICLNGITTAILAPILMRLL